MPAAKKILVVDDSAVVQKSMKIMLTKHGYEVLSAETPEDTIAILGRNRPDLILLDLDFPPDPASLLTDGFKTIEWARHYGIAPDVPVFIVSSLDPAKYQHQAKAAGIKTVFQKPVDEPSLLAAIHAKLAESGV